MAIASKCLVTVTVPKEVPGVQLTLSQEEATFLFDLCSNVGGHPTKSRRAYADRIGTALRYAGTARGPRDGERTMDVDQAPHQGAIYFKTGEVEL
jgi:hypothetical protein